MPNGTYGGVRGRKTKVGRKLLRFPPTRFLSIHVAGIRQINYSNEKTILISELTPCSPVGTPELSAIESASSLTARLF